MTPDLKSASNPRTTASAERVSAGPGVPRLIRLALPALLFIITFVAFSPALDNDLVDFDDYLLLKENANFRGLTPANVQWMFTSTVMGHYQPLTWLSYAIDYELVGERFSPSMFHLTSIVLHAASGLLLYFIAMRLFRAARDDWPELPLRLGAFAAASLWAVHPLRVESVAWATERRDVLSCFFLLGAALAYLRAFPPGSVRPSSVAWFVASIALLALSLLSKAWGMSFFVIVTVLDWYPLRRLPLNPLHWFQGDARRVLAQKAPYAFLGIAAALVAQWAIRSIDAATPLAVWPMGSRIAQSFYGLVWYIRATLWPANLSALYELRHGLNPLAPEYVASYAAAALTGALVLVLHRRAPALAAAVAIYVVTILPVLGLVQTGDQFVADRYSYISTMGFYLLAAGALLMLSRRVAAPLRAMLAAAPALLALAVIPVTMSLTRVWHDPVSLWQHAWQVRPTGLMGHVNYGINVAAQAGEVADAGDTAAAAPLFADAIEHFRIATRLKPDDGRAWHNLGLTLGRIGDNAGAEQAYREAAKYLPQAYLPLVNLGNLLMKQGRADEALAALRAAVEDVEHPRPGSIYSAKPYLALGAALEYTGDIQGARAAFQKALDSKDRDPEVKREAERRLARMRAVR